jgi:hypothetical protein
MPGPTLLFIPSVTNSVSPPMPTVRFRRSTLWSGGCLTFPTTVHEDTSASFRTIRTDAASGASAVVATAQLVSKRAVAEGVQFTELRVVYTSTR